MYLKWGKKKTFFRKRWWEISDTFKVICLKPRQVSDPAVAVIVFFLFFVWQWFDSNGFRTNVQYVWCVDKGFHTHVKNRAGIWSTRVSLKRTSDGTEGLSKNRLVVSHKGKGQHSHSLQTTVTTSLTEDPATIRKFKSEAHLDHPEAAVRTRTIRPQRPESDPRRAPLCFLSDYQIKTAETTGTWCSSCDSDLMVALQKYSGA